MFTTTTTTTTTRDRGDRYGPMEWAQQRRTCLYPVFWKVGLERQNFTLIYVRIVGVLESLFQLFQLVARENRSTFPYVYTLHVNYRYYCVCLGNKIVEYCLQISNSVQVSVRHISRQRDRVLDRKYMGAAILDFSDGYCEFICVYVSVCSLKENDLSYQHQSCRLGACPPQNFGQPPGWPPLFMFKPALRYVCFNDFF